MSWPQYPLDESLERVYCSEFFGEIPESFIHNLRPDSSFIQSSGRWFPQVASIGSTKVEESRNAAMAVGAGRAAGLIPQLGSAEAFNKVRTTTLPSSKWPATLQQFAPAYTRNSIGSDQHSTNSNYLIPSRSFQISGSELDMPTMSMLPDPQPLNENFILPQLPGSTQVPALISEFDLCSSTVDMVRSIASHQHNSLVIPDRSTQRIKLTGPGASCEPNALTMVKFEVEPDEIVGVQSMDSQSRQSLCTSLDMPSSQNVSLTEELHCLKASSGSLETKSPYFSSNHLSTESVADAKEIVVQSSDILHPAELSTETSSKRKNNEDIAAVQRIIKKAITPSCRQRKACKVEDFTDYECKDVQTESIEIKRYGSERGRNSKRGRAAEVHNLSERRRRDRINERLRALQDLIPTSNKTDKASMLDEAVEYLKMLQLQLQIMSMRTGMIIPPMLITPKMQYLQPLVQMQMETGTGLGMIDLATAAASTLPFPPYNPSSFEAAQYELYSSSDAVSRHMAACNPYSSLIDLTIPFLTRQQLHLQS